MLLMPIGPSKPHLVYHADWSSKNAKRWGARATLGADGRYTAHAPKLVDDPRLLLRTLRTDAGELGCIFVGFDFPIGLPVQYAKRAGISSFRKFLAEIGKGEWSDFYSVCHAPEEISLHRPFYPDGGYKGRRKQDLFSGHGVSSVEPLLRRCERGGSGIREACCLFWTLGGNQVGKAAICGWKEVLTPALAGANGVSLWPFDGALHSLFLSGNTVVAETYPAECYGWFSEKTLGSKRNLEDRKKFSASLLHWAEINEVVIKDDLVKSVREGFQTGADDAFDAMVGLLGMLQVCFGHRPPGEPNEQMIRDVEGWILGRHSQRTI